MTIRGDRRDDSYVLHFVPFAGEEKNGLAAVEAIILGILDLIRLLEQVDAISDPNELKPKFFLGCTNKTMANIAVRKLGFSFLVPTRTDRLTDALFSVFDSEHGNKSDQPERIFASVQSLHAKIPEMQLKVNKLIERFRGKNSYEEYIRQLRERSIRSLMNYLEMDGLQTVAMIPEME